MSASPLKKLDSALSGWRPPEAPDDIPQGDMPGDKVWIGPQSVEKANAVFRALAASPCERAVVVRPRA